MVPDLSLLADDWTVYRRLVAAQLRGQLEYRVSFWLDISATFIATFVDFVGIAILFGRVADLGGWRLGEIALLYGLVATSFAVANGAGYGFNDFGELVRRGTFDGVLLRPRSLVLVVMSSQVPLRMLGRLAQAVLVLGIAVVWTGGWQAWGPDEWLLLTATLLGGVLFYFGILMAGATLCFWTVESTEVVNIFTYGTVEMSSYPLGIFPAALRNFFTFIVPLAFIDYYPALRLLGRPDPEGWPKDVAWLALPIGCIVFLAGRSLWRFGVRHYLSTGS